MKSLLEKLDLEGKPQSRIFLKIKILRSDLAVNE